jgi:outer membrane protein TolC
VASRSTWIGMGEHALAVLCGRPASDFSVPGQPLDLRPPEIPPGLPSQILERRPDVAEGEQHLAGAFRDVEDALVDVRLRTAQGDPVAESVAATARAVLIARSQYDHGTTTYLQVILAESMHLDLELQAAQIQQQWLLTAVLLVKAIGGGWQ